MNTTEVCHCIHGSPRLNKLILTQNTAYTYIHQLGQLGKFKVQHVDFYYATLSLFCRQKQCQTGLYLLQSKVRPNALLPLMPGCLLSHINYCLTCCH